MVASVRVGILGELDRERATHTATEAAFAHAATALGLALETHWLASGEPARAGEFDAVLAAPGNPDMDAALPAIRVAREGGVPLLGTCAGFQYLVIEFARNALGLADADHAEWHPDAKRLLVAPLACSLAGQRAAVRLAAGSRVHAEYGRDEVVEEYRCSYGLDPEYETALERAGLRITGRDAAGAARVVELPAHPFYVGTLFVPQLSSRSDRPHPLFIALLRAAGKR